MSVAETVARARLVGDESAGTSDAEKGVAAVNVIGRTNIAKEGLAGEVRETAGVSDGLAAGEGRLRDVLGDVSGTPGWIHIADVDNGGASKTSPNSRNDLLRNVAPLEADDVQVFHAGFRAFFFECGIGHVGSAAAKGSGHELPCPHYLRPGDVGLGCKGEHGRACRDRNTKVYAGRVGISGTFTTSRAGMAA
ncbi:hypothetical protein ES705_27478 [subsurface metagenome]